MIRLGQVKSVSPSEAGERALDPRDINERAGQCGFLDLKSLLVTKVQVLSLRQKTNERSQALINSTKHQHKERINIFSNEKDFHVDKCVNCYNSSYVATSPEDVDPYARYADPLKYPAKARTLGYVETDSTAFLRIWVNGNLSSAQFKQILITIVRIWVCPPESASCHSFHSFLNISADGFNPG